SITRTSMSAPTFRRRMCAPRRPTASCSTRSIIWSWTRGWMGCTGPSCFASMAGGSSRLATMGLELGIVVADASMLSRALDLAHNVSDAQLFLMDDGVRAASAPALRAAIDDGLDATVCAMDAELHQIAAVPGGPRFGSQWDHAMMVRHAARVVGMTGGRIDD